MSMLGFTFMVAFQFFQSPIDLPGSRPQPDLDFHAGKMHFRFSTK